MRKSTNLFIYALVLFFFSLSQPAFLTPGPTQAAPERLYFAATGQSLQGKFLKYWQTRGGLAIFGYPLTPEFYEGGFLVQYFERNRFEYHPENVGSSYEILLGLMGRERLLAEGRSLPQPEARPATNGNLFFPQTGFGLAGPFLSYWQTNGGLAQFGFPITPLETTPDGRTVQFFERARFELHPENAGTPYEVLLGLLGLDRAGKLDLALRERRLENPPSVNLKLEGGARTVTPLTPLVISSDTPGELRVLGGDNRQYASLTIEANQPVTVWAAGAAGPQSLLLYRDGTVIAERWQVFGVSAPVVGIQSGDPVWDGLYPRVKGYLEKDVVVYYSPTTKEPVRGYRSPDTFYIWLRDHVHQAKGFKYFERDMKSTLDYFRSTQRPDGSFDDYFQHYPGYEVYKDQIEIEADREYLFIEGVWTTWQATGDDDWLKAQLGVMERGLEHTFSDPRRWSKEYGLVKRAFTIDTWDFEQGSDKGTRRKFDDKTRWSIMHGDNSGAYASARLLAQMLGYAGQNERATFWEQRAATLLQNLLRHSWNGSFFTHQIHLTPVDPTGVDEKTQLSLSNAYALNRGVLNQAQAAALLRTYQQRRASNASNIFAEWYSINPPFPLGFGPPGEYVNGGIMPLVGGELARGAFEYGFEAYGLDILRRYWQLLDQTGGSYLWYHPDGRPGIGTLATLPTDGWGSAAMLYALTEGLAGVVDNSKLYQEVSLAPRWAATDRTSAQVTLGYGASGAYFTYQWQRRPDKNLELIWGGAQSRAVQLHLLLPSDAGSAIPRQVLLNGQPITFTSSKIETSLYLDTLLPGNGKLEILY